MHNAPIKLQRLQQYCISFLCTLQSRESTRISETNDESAGIHVKHLFHFVGKGRICQGTEVLAARSKGAFLFRSHHNCLQGVKLDRGELVVPAPVSGSVVDGAAR